MLLDHGIDYQQGYKLRHSDGQYEDKTPEGFELRPIPVDDDRQDNTKDIV